LLYTAGPAPTAMPKTKPMDTIIRRQHTTPTTPNTVLAHELNYFSSADSTGSRSGRRREPMSRMVSARERVLSSAAVAMPPRKRRQDYNIVRTRSTPKWKRRAKAIHRRIDSLESTLRMQYEELDERQRNPHLPPMNTHERLGKAYDIHVLANDIRKLKEQSSPKRP
jgi:hypothetical protein